jgi:hypothetical protein
MLSLRDAVGHEAVPSIVALARQGNLAPPFSLGDFISNRFVEIEINVPGGIQLARAGDVEVSHAKVLLRSNGDWAISGSLHDHGTLVGDDFVLNFTALFTVTGSDGVTRGFSAPLIIGRLGAVFGPSRDFNFRSVGNNAFLQQNWQKISEMGIRVHLHASAAGDQPFSDLISAARKDIEALFSSPSEEECRDTQGNAVPCGPDPPETQPQSP